MLYVIIKAKNHYEAGFQLGKNLADLKKKYLLVSQPRDLSWDELIPLSKPFLKETEKYFPQYIDELHGLAEGAEIPFEKLWVKTCLEEILSISEEKCTTIFAKQTLNSLVGHNEDEDVWKKDYLFLQKRTIGEITTLEFNYALSLGGQAVSVNSFGLIQCINHLYHKNFQPGVPKKIIGRWLSEAPSFEYIKNELPKINRASGYNHVFIKNDQVLNIELTPKEIDITQYSKNYVHTNHYLGRLRKHSNIAGINKDSSYARYQQASKLVNGINDIDKMKQALSYQEAGKKYSILNKRTLGSMIINVGDKSCWVALPNTGLESGWEKFHLEFLK